ncbi:hypothetical protein GYMLUDRAFT_979813 [Collybiopsis luxurians FD-317 M1]|uniref:Uncharacterized protein n=1 Tax=Collybiopsis luxurians FD-317 M1 TaxID=944289 RepID=A0A0D0BBY3_9AGAR|nr:hypothetical protein GYMLUDRAFT_979813 [Collybiopsis luxurians FD-317 M1]
MARSDTIILDLSRRDNVEKVSYVNSFLIFSCCPTCSRVWRTASYGVYIYIYLEKISVTIVAL